MYIFNFYPCNMFGAVLVTGYQIVRTEEWSEYFSHYYSWRAWPRSRLPSFRPCCTPWLIIVIEATGPGWRASCCLFDNEREKAPLHWLLQPGWSPPDLSPSQGPGSRVSTRQPGPPGPSCRELSDGARCVAVHIVRQLQTVSQLV